jgi:hypothetical protein
MRCQAGIPIGHALRVGAAALGLVLISALNHPNADARTSPVAASIDAPTGGAQVDGVVEIRGSAMAAEGGRFGFYRILIGEGRTPVSLRPLGPPHERPVESGVLDTWDTDRFPSGEYTLTLHVYAADDTYVSASSVVTVKYKPTPTPLAILLPTVDAPTPAPTSDSVIAAGPVDAPPPLEVVIAPFDASAPSIPVPPPVPTIALPRAVVPIQPIPLDPNNPGPFPVNTPTTWSSGQLPGDPAPIYITPVDFNPSTY